jgi:hypothetical protein
MRCDAIEVFVMCCLDVAGGPGVWVRTRSDIRLRCAPQLVTDDRKQQAYDSDLQARCNAHARLLQAMESTWWSNNASWVLTTSSHEFTRLPVHHFKLSTSKLILPMINSHLKRRSSSHASGCKFPFTTLDLPSGLFLMSCDCIILYPCCRLSWLF